jgi:hypothetical protein
MIRALRINAFYYATAATTAIVGILHLLSAPNSLAFSINFAIFFIVAGIAQLLWTVPMIKKWGTRWYAAGIAGTAVLIALFVVTRLPNPITGRALPTSPMGIVIESIQAAFIGLSAAIILYEVRRKQLSRKTAADAA